MRKRDSGPMICDALSAAVAGLPNDYLAYLALTSKPENQIRDALAWQIHNELGGDAIVAREWTSRWHRGGGRIDLAILTPEGRPQTLIELKSFMSFNAVRPNDMSQYKGYIAHDIVRAKALDPEEVVAILISVHVATEVPAHLNRVVKYRYDINRALGHTLADDLWRQADAETQRSLGVLGKVRKVSIGTGVAFGIDCRIAACVVSVS